jgi:L-lysine exporter family protein LysE/ArgO
MLHHYQFEDKLMNPSWATKDVIKEQTNRDFDKLSVLAENLGLAQSAEIGYLMAYWHNHRGGDELLSAFIHGLVLALGLILPLGVQNVFIFNQGAVQPRLARALPAVLTAACCDALLILLAVTGISVAVLAVSWLRYALLGVGVCFLLYMGFITWRSRGDAPGELRETAAISPREQVMFAGSVSLLNPHAIMDTVGVIGASSLQYAGAEKMGFTAACILVSFVWFVFLAVAGRVLKEMKPGFIPVLNKLSAFFIWASAVYMTVLLLE